MLENRDRLAVTIKLQSHDRLLSIILRPIYRADNGIIEQKKWGNLPLA